MMHDRNKWDGLNNRVQEGTLCLYLGYNTMMIELDLKEKQIHQLLKLEELFHSHYLTQELLNELISLYVRFVENIHHNQHPLRLFFMQKIRFVLSRPEVIRILEKESQSHNRSIRDTVRGVMGINEKEEMEIKRMQQEAKAEIRKNHLINMKKENNGNDELREKERSMKIEMQMIIMQEVEANMTNFRKDIAHKQTNQQNQLKEIVNQQDQTLEQRRANRKKRLRKKSADLTQKQIVSVVEAQPIPKEDLKKVQMEINQTFERFTRLTQNRMKLESQKKENEGRVKFQIQNTSYEEEEMFDHPAKGKQVQPMNFAKKKSAQKVTQAQVSKVKDETGQVQAKTAEQKQGRVTVRKNQYEQLEEPEFF